MKYLIVVPSFKLIGGVANHYQGLSKHWKEKNIYSTCGKRINFSAVLCFIPDIVRFIIKLLFYRVDVVIINPSLRAYQLFRDSIYLMIAFFFNKKVVTFIHGWDDNMMYCIKRRPFLFKRIYGRSLFIYVLCEKFKNELDRLHMNSPVLLTTTKVTDELLSNFEISTREGNIKQILFLARLEKNKGVFVAIDAFKYLKERYNELKLVICGNGGAYNEAKEYVSDNSLDGIEFKGNIFGQDIIKYYTESDLYILPTTHGEGMATSVLEAMAFGLPVVSRPVGGVVDFFENNKMGYLLESLDPRDYATVIEGLINNPSQVKEISKKNYEYAQKHFLASIVAKNIESDISKYMNN